MVTLDVTPLSGYPDEIGSWLWSMEEVRRRTLRVVTDLEPATLDWEGPDGRENSIGTLLYHIALVETSWLHCDLLGHAVPAEILQHLPHPMGTNGRLTPVLGDDLATHVARLEVVRTDFLAAFRGMSVEDWHRLRDVEGEDYVVNPAWTVFHLVEHEAIHTGQISTLKNRVALGQAS